MNNMFEGLTKEIVCFCQNPDNSHDECVEFVLYELYLRTVSKNYLEEISRQREPVEGKTFFDEDKRLGK